MRLAHFVHLFGIGSVFWGVVNLVQTPRSFASATFFFVLAAVAFAAGYMLDRRRLG